MKIVLLYKYIYVDIYFFFDISWNMSKYYYTDLILEAFMEFRRPMTLDEVVDYVAEMTNKSADHVRLHVDNTLTAAWLYGFVERDEDHLFTLPNNNQSVNSSSSNTTIRTLNNSNTDLSTIPSNLASDSSSSTSSNSVSKPTIN